MLGMETSDLERLADIAASNSMHKIFPIHGKLIESGFVCQIDKMSRIWRSPKADKNVPSCPKVENLTELDKLYLLLAEHSLGDSFNVLCYDLKIRSINDLNGLDDEALKRLRFLKFGKDQLKQLPQKVGKIDFVSLALKYGKLPYRAQLESHGVPFISVDEIHVVKKTASGPVSGSVFEAIWTKSNGEKIRVCLRYDRGQAQRKHFLHEAELTASVNHENLLHLYGVILPGLYTDSVALVVDFAEYGNINEAMPLQSVYSLVKVITQIAAALEYLDSKGLVHMRIRPVSVFVVAPGKAKLGGLWGCFRRDQKEMTQSSVKSSTKKGEVVCWFAQFAKDMFRTLAFHQDFLSSTREKLVNRALMPDVLKNLFEQCNAKNPKNRPRMSDVAKTLSTFSLPKLLVKADCNGQTSHKLSCKKGEVILLISKAFHFLEEKVASSSGNEAWLCEKRNGSMGLLDPSNAEELLGHEDISWETLNQNVEEEPSQTSSEAKPDKDSTVPPEIQARGIEAKHAFQRALKKGKVRVYRGRVMLIGQNRAGKTSLKKSLLGLKFDPGEESTEGIEVDPSRFELDVDRVMNWQLVKNEKFTSEFADDIARLVVGELRSGDEEKKPEVNSSEVEPVQTDVTQGASAPQSDQVAATSFAEQDFPADTPSDHSSAAGAGLAELLQDAERFHIEVDSSRTVPEDVKSLVAKYLESQAGGEHQASDRETVVTIWDFAGQHLYYASHPVFLSPRAVYVLVYNLSKELSANMEPCVRQGVHDFIPHSSGDETNLDSILSWLVSIHNLSAEVRAKEKDQEEEQPYLRPPVIIVGTHADNPFEDPKRMETQIKTSLSRKTYAQHVRRPFYRVDNTRSGEDEGVRKVRQEIREVLRLEPYMGEDVPVRWFNFERVVEALVQQKVFYLKVSQLYFIASKTCLIEDETEMVAMLDFYHDLGIVIWHGDTVVLQTQWLIHLFRKLITIRPFDEQNPRHAAAWNELEETGLLSMRLVDHVFAEFLCDGQSQNDILCMMEMYGLIARFTPKSEAGEDSPAVKYFVPAQLCSCPETELDTTESEICPLYINFTDGFLPHGLFPQLVSRFISVCPELGCTDEPNLFQNLARFILGESDLFLIGKQSFIKVILQTKNSDDLAGLVRERLESILSSLSSDFACLRNMRYEFSVACPSCCNKASTKNKTKSCTENDRIHFIPISNDGKLICTKTFGARSRLEIPGVEKWRGCVKKTDEPSPPDVARNKTFEDEINSPSEIAARPAVFISYQWGLQDTVKVLRNKLEEAGFECWMDIGQMGGGDALYAEIDAGIRASKVVICCVTKRYCVSEMCQREVTLADTLRKPIIPVLFEFIDWPPPGQLALIFAKLLYIDMSQGPTGSFPEDKLQELFLKVNGHVER